MERSLLWSIKKDLPKKIILLTGPRQCGKTTLAKMLASNFEYFNYDEAEQRLMIQEKSWNRETELLILDELHKMPKWKRWLKGIYDTEGLKPPLVVTGSAQLDTYKKAGDSLAGRFFQFRLHPLDLKEIVRYLKPASEEKTLDQLLQVGPFPEPFLEGDPVFYHRWKKSHLHIIIKQDLIELEHVQHILQIETLIQLLKKQVGSPVSYSSLAENLQVNDKTIKRWLTLLENMYVIFKVTPYHKNIARSLLKQPKYYFYDTGQVEGELSARLENLVACALLKEMHYREDVLGESFQLFYLRNKLKQEIDFLLVCQNRPIMTLEVKWGDDTPSKNFDLFGTFLPKDIKKIQIVKDLKKEKSYPNGLALKRASSWLASLDF